MFSFFPENEGLKREKQYAGKLGSFLYFFRHKEQKLW